MTKAQVATLFNFVSSIKLNKVEDKALRKWVLDTHIATYKVVKGIQEDTDELRKKVFEGKDEAVKEYSEKFGKDASYKPSEDIVAAVAEFNASVADLYNAQCKVEVKHIKSEDIDALLAAREQDYTVGDIIAIEEILK